MEPVKTFATPSTTGGVEFDDAAVMEAGLTSVRVRQAENGALHVLPTYRNENPNREKRAREWTDARYARENTLHFDGDQGLARIEGHWNADRKFLEKLILTRRSYTLPQSPQTPFEIGDLQKQSNFVIDAPIVGFFGRCGVWSDQLGVYLGARATPLFGKAGRLFFDRTYFAKPEIRGLSGIEFHNMKDRIVGAKLQWLSRDLNQEPVHPPLVESELLGTGSVGTTARLKLSSDEKIIAVDGLVGGDGLRSLSFTIMDFRTGMRRVWSTGSEAGSGERFTVEGTVLSMFARIDDRNWLKAIGFFTAEKPRITAGSWNYSII